MRTDEDVRRLLFKADRAVGRHLFLLGLAILVVIVAGLAAPVVVVAYAISQSQPWYVGTGATVLTLAGVAVVLHAVPRILGPEGITDIVKERHRSPAIPLIGSDDLLSGADRRLTEIQDDEHLNRNGLGADRTAHRIRANAAEAHAEG